MKYLLDTDICIYILNERDEGLLDRFRSLRPIDVGVATVTAAELLYGAARSAQSKKNRDRVETFLRPLAKVAFDTKAAEAYAPIRSDLEKRGSPIGSLDMLIAATAVAHGLTLVTNNTDEFRRVKRLKIENWVHRG